LKIMEREVAFYSSGFRLVGDIRVPGDVAPGERRAAIVLCHGFGGIRQLILPTLAATLANAGYVVFRFDHRGFGASEGPRWRLIPLEQVEDIRNAITFLSLQPEVDRSRIGLYGTSFGGGNAVYVAGIDDRVQCAVAAVPVGNGERWLRGLRRYWEWKAFLVRIDDDRARRVATGESEMVDSDEIMVPDPESDAWHEEVLQQFPERAYRLPLESAEAVIEYRPEDVVHRIAPRPVLFIHAGDDDLVPPEMSQRLYERAGQPKRLVVIPGVKHHSIYEGQPYQQVMSAAMDWFGVHLPPGRSEVGR
jgi:alpha-beta hydrolase superfamily lysophospholipase